MTVFVKQHPDAPPRYFAWEVAGLNWLSAADGGVPCADVISFDAVSLTLRRLESVRPSVDAARTFGSQLAMLHEAGASGFGVGPPAWAGPGFFGPLSQPLPMSTTEHRRWGEYYVYERLWPMVDLASARLDTSARALLDGVVERCLRGDFDDGDQPARLHGDLWSGNVMWTPRGVVLIDPAAHAGHRETDLAMLSLFGCPHYEAIIAGYQEVSTLQSGWRKRAALHQLFPLLAHVVLFGDAYAQQTEAAASAALVA